MDTPSIPQKRCPKCGNTYPATTECFHRNRNAKDGLYTYCKSCAIADARHWQNEHTERVRENDRRRYYNNLEVRKAGQKRWQDKNRSYIHDYRLAWARNNPDKVKAINKRRAARKKQLDATFTANDWDRCLDYWHNCCAYCGRPRGLWHTLAQDHYIPVSRGGGYTTDNILPACHGVDGCNNSKHNNDPREWLARKFGNKKAKSIERKIEIYFKGCSKQST